MRFFQSCAVRRSCAVHCSYVLGSDRVVRSDRAVRSNRVVRRGMSSNSSDIRGKTDDGTAYSVDGVTAQKFEMVRQRGFCFCQAIGRIPLRPIVRKLATLLASVLTTILVSSMMLIGAGAPANASQLPNPDLVPLLADYERLYWQAPTKTSGGKVLDVATMQHDDALAVAINNEAAKNPDAEGHSAQVKRALIDSDLYGRETMPDALGPTLGGYMTEGLTSGKLNLIVDLFKFNVASTYKAKNAAMHPRPYLDRSNHGANDLGGLSDTLDIQQTTAWGDHLPGYGNLQTNSSFPSGHTTTAYSWGVMLAGMIPELAPQIMARTSEAGNNRIVLGVHYPLDVIGGRIAGSVENGYYWHNYYGSKIVPAAQQLRNWLTERCRADGHGDTLPACISSLNADGEGGYQNDFIDPIATQPVTDKASATSVYTARMTYGFPQREGGSGKPFSAPQGAADVLRLAYPQLHADQRDAVLKLTAIDSGYPLWESSRGWQRINWAKALCATVTLDNQGNVVSVRPNAKAPTVVNAQYADTGAHPASDAIAGENTTFNVGRSADVVAGERRLALIVVAVMTVIGAPVIVLSRRRSGKPMVSENPAASDNPTV